MDVKIYPFICTPQYLLFFFVFTKVLEAVRVRFLGHGIVFLFHQGGGVLHLKDGVLAEVDEGLQLLLVSLSDDGVEETTLRVLDLRLLPLVDVLLLDLEVHAFDALRAAHDLDSTQEGLEVVQDRTSSLGKQCHVLFPVI